VFTVVGIPEMIPVDAARDSPEGRLPDAIDQVTEPVAPLTDRVRLYATPTVPFGSELVLMLGAAAATPLRSAMQRKARWSWRVIARS
jgi:hypothetical protein